MYNRREEIRKFIAAARKGQDWWALAYLLSEVSMEKNPVDGFEKLRKSKAYPARLKDSYKQIKKRVQYWDAIVKKEGDRAFADISEKGWHLDNKELLKLLELEAKRQGINL